jgi:hypothetical protein
MTYHLIKTPYNVKFTEMSKQELHQYFQWFLEIILPRVRELTIFVNQTSGYENWKSDFTPETLDSLGEWFAAQVTTRQRSSEERAEITSQSPYPIDIANVELTDHSFSLSMDIAIYLSQVLLKNFPQLRWSQTLGSKRDIDYGQPVLVGFKGSNFNPVHVLGTLAYGLSRNTKTSYRLRELYDIWSKHVAKNRTKGE